jgi:hypothetical protein
VNPISDRKLHVQAISIPAKADLMYSASPVDWETIGWSLLLQDMALLASIVMYLLVDHWLSTFLV